MPRARKNGNGVSEFVAAATYIARVGLTPGVKCDAKVVSLVLKKLLGPLDAGVENAIMMRSKNVKKDKQT